MSKVRMVHKEDPKHGPVKRITDPAELARLGEKYSPKALPVPCNGNSINLHDLGLKEQTITDHEIVNLLKVDDTRPENERLSPKERSALVQFRLKLSKSGANSFSHNQMLYLHTLVYQVEHPGNVERITPEQKKELYRKVKVLFEFMKEKKEDQVSARTIVDFFGLEVALAVPGVTKILGKYGLEKDAMDFVFECGKRYLYLYYNHLSNVPVKLWGKELYKRLLVDLRGESPFPSLSELPRILGDELKGVPASAIGIAKDKMDYVIKIARYGFFTDSFGNCNEIAAGSPGSGKGGDGR